MGRHSSPEQGPFVRSVLTWFLPWALLGAVALTAVWFAVDAVGRDELETRPPPPSVEASATPTPTPTPSPSPEATPEDEPSATATAQPRATKEATTELITDVTVQVLNGTSSSEADDAMADRLARLGFDVIAIDSANTSYPQTTVFWSYPQAQEAAQRLAARFGWAADVKPDNLSTQVALHVVVGADET